MTNPYQPPQEPLQESHAASGSALSATSVVVLSFLMPGLPSIRQGQRLAGFTILCAIPVAFLFFGPFWGIVLFRGTPWSEAGLYPFLAVTFMTPVASLLHGMAARRRRLQSQPDDKRFETR
ncbi:MAG: hypothetical protein AAFX06_17100 [Planctomycetota bacterium]